MKISEEISLVAAVLCSTPSWASTIPVLVQCNPLGPVYTGTLEFDNIVADWKFERCSTDEGYGGLPNHYMGDYQAPIRISFNGMSYKRERAIRCGSI